ncbi:6-phosphogluconate dehydrogenase NAD-binding protein [Gemmatirosa kalamazoonensis]|uniref:6-phosphogluconate dehydrogenase NAD-binding protein n=1 Tax=Gemmatirosa kalamazoonensis TaxID=861299 RepID=W0RQP8_9BACT|nr:6-phosphogluconate dehydrogenase NAD-binding protein [Gemmatirosa kalamazoonensis]
MNVAFLGLGAIGAPMAGHLAAPPFALTVWNRTRERALRFVETHRGARVADTAAEAVRGAEFVITCVPSSREVEALVDGELLDAIPAGALFIDCTSGDPATSRHLAERLAERGIGFVDAPVSGGVIGAEKGTLTVMVGGDAALLDRARPVLAAFGEKIVHCGAIGAGDALKAVNNALLAVHLWSTAEGLAVLERAGVRADIALDVINTSSGRSNASMNLFPERVLTRAFPRTFRLALLDKDVGIGADLARQQKVPAPILQLTAELFRMAHATLGEEADHVEAARIVEQWAAVTIGGPRPSADAPTGVSPNNELEQEL